MINDMGIPVYEKAPDAESLLLTDATAAPDEKRREATAALANLDAEFGRTPIRCACTCARWAPWSLLTREGEIRIAKRIEEGLEAVKIALAAYPAPTICCCGTMRRSGRVRCAW